MGVVGYTQSVITTFFIFAENVATIYDRPLLTVVNKQKKKSTCALRTGLDEGLFSTSKPFGEQHFGRACPEALENYL